MRTRQTSAGIEPALTGAGRPYDQREAVELRELSFGLFDGIADEDLAKSFPREHEHYDKHKRFEGEFFAPMPLGESRAHVADRVKGVFGTILRDASPDRTNPISTFIVVSHGVTIRCFRMQWMHYPWEWCEHEKNPLNCSIQLLEGRVGSGYVDRLVFPGFAHARESPQARREEGHVG
jgi:2,3-bisphosphoglycerate-dependent phosphoglycerate mutase